jgi:hypothetical protein
MLGSIMMPREHAQRIAELEPHAPLLRIEATTGIVDDRSKPAAQRFYSAAAQAARFGGTYDTFGDAAWGVKFAVASRVFREEARKLDAPPTALSITDGYQVALIDPAHRKLAAFADSDYGPLLQALTDTQGNQERVPRPGFSESTTTEILFLGGQAIARAQSELTELAKVGDERGLWAKRISNLAQVAMQAPF